MNDSIFIPFLLLLPLFDWTVTGALFALALQRPLIPFLTERAAAALVISIVTTAYAFIAMNVELEYLWLDRDTARVIVRSLMVLLGAAPILWLVSFWRRR